MPPEYGPATTVYNRYNRWSRRGLWQRLFEQVAASGRVPQELLIDASRMKAHRSVAGGKGGSGSKRLAARAAGAPQKSTAWPLLSAVVWLKQRRIKAVIPSSSSRAVPYPLDRTVYRRRNLIEMVSSQMTNSA